MDEVALARRLRGVAIDVDPLERWCEAPTW
jgi:hypothetical protein